MRPDSFAQQEPLEPPNDNYPSVFVGHIEEDEH